MKNTEYNRLFSPITVKEEDLDIVFSLDRWDEFLAFFQLDPKQKIILNQIPCLLRDVPKHIDTHQTITWDIQTQNTYMSYFFRGYARETACTACQFTL